MAIFYLNIVASSVSITILQTHEDEETISRLIAMILRQQQEIRRLLQMIQYFNEGYVDDEDDEDDEDDDDTRYSSIRDELPSDWGEEEEAQCA